MPNNTITIPVETFNEIKKTLKYYSDKKLYRAKAEYRSGGYCSVVPIVEKDRGEKATNTLKLLEE